MNYYVKNLNLHKNKINIYKENELSLSFFYHPDDKKNIHYFQHKNLISFDEMLLNKEDSQHFYTYNVSALKENFLSMISNKSKLPYIKRKTIFKKHNSRTPTLKLKTLDAKLHGSSCHNKSLEFNALTFKKENINVVVQHIHDVSDEYFDYISSYDEYFYIKTLFNLTRKQTQTLLYCLKKSILNIQESQAFYEKDIIIKPKLDNLSKFDIYINNHLIDFNIKKLYVFTFKDYIATLIVK